MLGADAVVAAIGVNVHSFYGVADPTNSYAQPNWPYLPASIGIRHVRDNPDFAASPPAGYEAATIAAHKTLVASGVDTGVILSAYDGNTGPTAVAALAAYVAAGLPVPVSIEGYQEVDFYWANWFTSQAAGFAGVEAWQPIMFNDMLAAYPPGVVVLGPSLSNPAFAATIGNLEPSLDAVNEHAYQTGAAAPEPAGSYYRTFFAANQTGPGLPIWFTETGMSSGPDPTVAWCTELACARLYPRMILEAAILGVSRLYFYELLDEHVVGNTNDQDRFGLFHPNLAPKSQATALANFISLLADISPEPFSPPADLPFLTVGTSTTATQQMAKRDGEIWVAVWQAQQVVTNPLGNGAPYKAGTDLADTNTPVTITFPGRCQSIAAYRPMLGATPIIGGVTVATFDDVDGNPFTVLTLLSQLDVTLVQLVGYTDTDRSVELGIDPQTANRGVPIPA